MDLFKMDIKLGKPNEFSNIHLVFIIILKLLRYPLKWNFHDGGFGLPHLNDDSFVMIRYPLIPFYFEISFYRNPNRIIYPVLFWPVFLFLFIYVSIFRLLFVSGC